MTAAERIAKLSEPRQRLLGKMLSENTSAESKVLVAYFSAQNQVEQEDLMGKLRAELPEYMLPGTLVQLENLPRLSNGKIDVKSLPQPQTASASRKTNVELTDIHKRLLKIWSEVLGTNDIDIRDNFFEIGGDSLLSIAIISRCRQEGIFFTPNQFFKYQSIAELVQSFGSASYERPRNLTELQLIRLWEKYLDRRLIGIQDDFFHLGGDYQQFLSMLDQVNEEFDVVINPGRLKDSTISAITEMIPLKEPGRLTRTIPLRSRGKKQPLFCIHSAYFFETVYADLARSMDHDQPVYGILSMPKGLSEADMPGDIPEMASRCVDEILAVKKEGPYFILGWSISNVIAYEVCQQLCQRNFETTLVMLDPPVFSSEDHTFKMPLPEKVRYFMRLATSPRESIKKVLNKIEERARKREANEEMKEVFRNTGYLQKLLGDYHFSASDSRAIIFETPADHIKYKIYDFRSLLPNTIYQTLLGSGHESILREPLIAEIARTIQEKLDKEPGETIRTVKS